MAYAVNLLFANNATSTIAGPINNSATTMQLAAGTGAKFPAPVSGQGYVGTLTDSATGLLKEIVLVTAMSGDQVTTMVRAQEGTTALAWSAGDIFEMDCTAGTMAALQQILGAQPTREIQGATGAFALTNADGSVGIHAVAATSTVLPPAPANGQVVEIADLVGNFQAFNCVVTPNTGQTIANQVGGTPAGSVTLNVNRGGGRFKFYATTSTWSQQLWG